MWATWHEVDIHLLQIIDQLLFQPMNIFPLRILSDSSMPAILRPRLMTVVHIPERSGESFPLLFPSSILPANLRRSRTIWSYVHVLALSKDIQVHSMRMIHSDQGGEPPNPELADTLGREGTSVWWTICLWQWPFESAILKGPPSVEKMT